MRTLTRASAAATSRWSPPNRSNVNLLRLVLFANGSRIGLLMAISAEVESTVKSLEMSTRHKFTCRHQCELSTTVVFTFITVVRRGTSSHLFALQWSDTSCNLFICSAFSRSSSVSVCASNVSSHVGLNCDDLLQPTPALAAISTHSKMTLERHTDTVAHFFSSSDKQHVSAAHEAGGTVDSHVREKLEALRRRERQ